MRRIFGAFIFVGVLAAMVGLDAGAAISLNVRPAVLAVRGNAQLKVLVEPNDANRVLTWEVDGPGYYRSSAMPLEGASSPRMWLFYVRDLPEGEFTVRATVTRNNNSESAAVTTIAVMPGIR